IMVKDKYNPDKDYSGPSRADYLIRKHGSIENAPKLINKKANPLEKTLDILKNTPVDLINFGNGQVFNRVFKEIVKTGYVIKNSYGIPINDFSIIDAPKKRDIYISLMKEFNLLNKKE
ncbi:MAG: hypothetical protein NTZ83_05165, partial [Candidatus Pacearchaeota archaeon]|nr:hypothetical protein [Candidatus Pacearchaeota archaeon]